MNRIASDIAPRSDPRSIRGVVPAPGWPPTPAEESGMNPTTSLGHGEPESPGADALRLAAMTYVSRGWFVLPLWWPTRSGDCACGVSDCDSVGKHPIRRLVTHGLRDATDHVATASEWWQSYPNANVAVRTGRQSGLVVLDVDGEAGRLALRGLVACHEPFQARWVRTGSGGWHAYFAHPGGPVPNSAGRLGEGLDVRGDGGYVVAPPSRHATHLRYRWVGQDDAGGPPDGVEVPPIPAWLLELAAPADQHSTARQPMWLRTDDVSAYAAAAVEREAHGVAIAPTGQRNHQLNRAAFKLGQLVGAGVVDELIATNALVDAGLAAGPGERKIRSTVRRGLRAGMLQPRHLVLHTPEHTEADRC